MRKPTTSAQHSHSCPTCGRRRTKREKDDKATAFILCSNCKRTATKQAKKDKERAALWERLKPPLYEMPVEECLWEQQSKAEIEIADQIFQLLSDPEFGGELKRSLIGNLDHLSHVTKVGIDRPEFVKAAYLMMTYILFKIEHPMEVSGHTIRARGKILDIISLARDRGFLGKRKNRAVAV